MTDKTAHTILLVDDEVGILKALSRTLRDIDARIITASNGQEGLEIINKQKVSLIISDHQMPNMTGVEFLKIAKKISPETIRILLTGYADIDITIDAINNGEVRYYFNKPWDEDLLISRINESLEMFQITAENKRLLELTKAQNEELRELNQTLEQRVAKQTKMIRMQHADLQKSFMETIKAFSTLLELRFKEMGFHSHRVANLAKVFLKRFNLPEKEYQDIIVSAFLHDIGKVAISEEIILKDADQLTSSELAELAKHSILGQSCLCAINGFEEIAIIIRHHHEDFNGQGYPDGLKEKAIPFGSRVIRLLDSFDRHAFKNNYPDLKRLNDATASLVQHSGSKFDPELVKKFIEYDIGKAFFHQENSDVILLRPDELRQGMVISADVYTKSGLFVVPKGARLSPGMIKRIIKISKADAITSGIQVFKKTGYNGAKNEKVQHFVSR